MTPHGPQHALSALFDGREELETIDKMWILCDPKTKLVHGERHESMSSAPQNAAYRQTAVGPDCLEQYPQRHLRPDTKNRAEASSVCLCG